MVVEAETEAEEEEAEAETVKKRGQMERARGTEHTW